MIPNKKNTNGWILCPSKSFPGKFYYFNVATGETAWCLNETEKKSIKTSFQNIDHAHSYPEPSSSPPLDIPSTTKPTIHPNLYPRHIKNNIWAETQNNPINYTNRSIPNASTFAIQPPYQNYTNSAMPIQIQVPMVMGTNFQNHPPVLVILMNQNPQYSQLAIDEPKLVPVQPEMESIRELFVNSETIPLCQRFVNYEKPVLQFENNKIKQPFSSYSSTPKKHFQNYNHSLTSLVTYQNCSDIINCQSNSDSGLHGKILTTQEKNLTNVKVNRSIFSPIYELDSPKNLSPVFTKSYSNGNLFEYGNFIENPFKKPSSPKSTINQYDKVDIATSPINTSSKRTNCEDNVSPLLIAKENATLTQGDKVVLVSSEEENLDQNDLRRILMAKKRKVGILDKSVESKKIKTSKQDCPAAAPKKKVTFNLIPENMSDIMSSDNFSNDGNLTNTIAQPDGVLMMKHLKQLRSPSRVGMWYLVVDTNALINNLAYLEKLVQLDPDCYLLIPSRVMSETSALARAECRERHLVTLARNSVRRLATPRGYIAVQSSHERDLTQTVCDSILNCCLEVMDQNSHVVLLTNDTNLRDKAESLNIPCFDCDQIKKGSVLKPDVHFDIKKIKISIKNDVLDQKSTETEYENSVTKNRPSIFENSFNSEAGKAECGYSKDTNAATDLSNLNIHNVPIGSKFKNVPNPNEKSSLYFQTENSNFERESKTKNSKELPQTVSFYFQNGKDNENNIGSIFKQANKEAGKNKSIFEIDKEKQSGKKKSTFEIDGIEKIESNNKKPSVNEIKKSIFDEKLKNYNIQLKKCNFEKLEFDENRKSWNESIFEIDIHNQNLMPSKIEQNLDKFVKEFILKNGLQERIAEKTEEIICNFEQVIEECLTNVLQVSTSTHKSEPPWTTLEAIQTLKKMYGDHTYLQTYANVLISILSAKGKITPRDILKMIACGVHLIKYLKKILPKCEILIDTENNLNSIVQNLTDENYGLNVQPDKPTFTNDIANDGIRRRNFVKDRSEVVKYLKNHFPGWANYDEALEEANSKATWGQTYKGTRIVRTSGRNIGLLKISNCKKMTMSRPNDCEDAEENVQNDNNILHNKDDDSNETVLLTNINIYAKNGLKSEKNDNETVIKLERNDGDDHKNDMTNMIQPSAVANKIGVSKTAQPKVVRLFNNNSLTKDNTNPKSVCNIDYTHGHTFGTEIAGPKVVRNMHMIKEFEEKLKKKPLNLDKLDYSALNDNLSLQTGSNCQLVIDEKYELNDEFTQKNDTQNGLNDGYATNNESYSMSLDNCVSNDVPEINDSKKYMPINDCSTNDKCLSSDHVSCLTNIMNRSSFYDDFYTKNRINNEVNDSYATNDTKVTQKDDTTNDSGFENESSFTYSVMKSFLYEINSSFKMVHKYIEGSIQVFRAGSLQDGKKQALHSKASATQAQISKIINKLKCIIERELSEDANLKSLLVPQSADDEQISRYRRQITQCLKQAEMLEQALKIMLSITDSSTANGLVKT